LVDIHPPIDASILKSLSRIENQENLLNKEAGVDSSLYSFLTY
jgi:hypothetical protein